MPERGTTVHLKNSQSFPFNQDLGQGPKGPGPTDCQSPLLWPGLSWWAGQESWQERYQTNYQIIGNPGQEDIQQIIPATETLQKAPSWPAFSELDHWSERSACAALGCWHKCRWPL
jgi:hypothetical protein